MDDLTRSLILRAQRGDEEAVSALYETYVQRIYRYVYYRVPTQMDAEDLTADVFTRMIQSLPDYRISDVPFEVWLYRIANARVIDLRRRRENRSQVPLEDEDDLLDQQDDLKQLRKALDSLPEEYKSILTLRFVERKTHEDVAHLLDKTVSSVKSAQHRALRDLAAFLGSAQKSYHYLRGE